ncbi:hypothetical protein [Allohahella marinimesophila]|uniref:Uncharacterized protein n=1 Tax=Allohahella marinimesophila TaxID=1054972 RepID=A0ABP7NFS6_9GAMM
MLIPASLKSPLLRSVLTASLGLSLGACVVSPHHGEHVGNTNSTIPFEIYALAPNAAIEVTCAHHYGGSMPVTSVTGSSNPITFSGEVVYPKTFNTALPSNCWESWTGRDFNYITYLHVKVNGYNATTYDEDGLDCLFGKIADGIGPITAGSACRRDGNSILLYAN